MPAVRASAAAESTTLPSIQLRQWSPNHLPLFGRYRKLYHPPSPNGTRIVRLLVAAFTLTDARSFGRLVDGSLQDRTPIDCCWHDAQSDSTSTTAIGNSSSSSSSQSSITCFKFGAAVHASSPISSPRLWRTGQGRTGLVSVCRIADVAAAGTGELDECPLPPPPADSVWSGLVWSDGETGHRLQLLTIRSLFSVGRQPGGRAGGPRHAAGRQSVRC